MSNYQMPVLTEQEREREIKACHAEIVLLIRKLKTWGEAWEEYILSQIVRQKIALAALTAAPMGKVDRGNYDDTGSYPDAKVVCLHVQADWENFGTGTLLYLYPPVPVIKQEGEQ